ncbi:hypothetical protein CTheo_7036 [Ceratobasidium theobromae]|uniref:OTU domain-containing protein n=1 Tax=Ceratobasidium theobromae TaxID=1582974 RepID=A0A5N5QD50_9AGAM|nr:hypothetical protein CTheo_7036 [Ceratobasidium theobromae]
MAKGSTRKERRPRVPVNACKSNSPMPEIILTFSASARPRTRGQRAKLHDPAANTAQLTAQLRSMGLYAAPTLGDGNCLFRALSDQVRGAFDVEPAPTGPLQIYGTPNEHLTLRQEICTYMASHKERFEAFVDDDRSWDQHISAMWSNGTYGGHLELTAFAQMKLLNVKVVQPGLVYVIEGARTENFGGSNASTPAAVVGAEDAPTSSRDKRKARRERMKKKAGEEVADDDDEDGASAPFPATVYVAYHDWEHFSSVRNLTGPHQGMPNVCEVPEPDTSSLPSPPPSHSATNSRSKHKQQSIPAPRPPTPDSALSTLSDSPCPLTPPRRSPKRAMTEEDEGDEEEEVRKRGRRGTITTSLVEAEEDAESESATGVSVSASAESGSFISDAPPPPPPEPEPEPEPEPAPVMAEKLTKRQRKSLGLPRARASTGAGAAAKTRGRRSVGAKELASMGINNRPNTSTTTTNGQPEKRETRSATKVHRDAGKVRDLGTGEWLDNGTGRLDVRGFRELRI